MTGTDDQREVFDRLLREGAGHDGIDPAIEVAGNVFDRLAGADGAVAENGIAAELFDGQLEGHVRAQRGLFEEQRDGCSSERAGVIAGGVFDVEREVQEVGELVVGEVEITREIGSGEAGDLVRGDVGSHGDTSG